MKVFEARVAVALALAIALASGAVCVQGAAAKSDSRSASKAKPDAAPDSKSDSSTPLLPGTNSKEPISIEANKLVYFDKQQKAIYTGNVVVIQGDTKMTCSVMTIFMEKAPEPARPAAGAKAAEGAGTGPSASSSRVKHLDAVGPVTILSKTQVATGDTASYDKAQNKVWLIGNVTLSDGGNVTKGDKLTYDLTSGEAIVDTGSAANRVKGLFIPGSGSGPSDTSKSRK